MLRTKSFTELYKGLVSNTAGTLVTTTEDVTQITRFIAHNTSGAAVTLDIWVVNTGDTRGNKDKLFSESIPAGATWVSPDLGMFLAPDTDIDAQAGTTNVVALRVESIAYENV